jgi:hypothetical protein
MEKYRNLSGNSRVAAYEIGVDSIKVQFMDGEIYLYNHNVPGKDQVEYMKVLARNGIGLCTFINRFVQNSFAEKN